MAIRKVLRGDGTVARINIKRNARFRAEYGRVWIGGQERYAWQRKPSEVRALEIVRGSGVRLRRIRYVLKDPDYAVGRKGKERRGANPEGHLVVVIPEGRIREFKEAVGAEVEARTPFSPSWHVEANDEAGPSVVGVEDCEVFTYGRSEPQAGLTSGLRDIAEAVLEDLDLVGPPEEEPEQGAAAAILRSERDARGRYRDPATGRFTLNPEAVK